MFCLPFIVVLSLSGSVYLFKPQIDAFLDRDFDHLTLARPAKTLDDQVEAALAANPTARIKAVQLRDDPTDATRVHLMTQEGKELRVLVRPDTLEIMKTEAQKSRLTNLVPDLHGELLIGEPGAIAVELAGAWAIVMVITGLYLWWPRSSSGLAGVLYPRLGGGRRFLRDLHAVTGIWLSFFALFFLLSALPWTKVWGEGFKYVRTIGERREVRQDWTTGPASEKAQRMETYRDAPAARSEAISDEHAEHMAGGEHAHVGQANHGDMAARITGFDELAAQVAPLHFADPVLISPPSARKPNWVARSDAQNRTLRATIEFNPKSFEQIKEEQFADRPLVDRIINIGVAAHEGQILRLVQSTARAFDGDRLSDPRCHFLPDVVAASTARSLGGPSGPGSNTPPRAIRRRVGCSPRFFLADAGAVAHSRPGHGGTASPLRAGRRRMARIPAFVRSRGGHAARRYGQRRMISL